MTAAIVLALGLAYFALTNWYIRWWQRLDTWVLPDNYEAHSRISVLIAARNEAAHIAACLESIVANEYPAHLLEILVVDDHSDDETARIAARFPGVRVLQLPAGRQGKKAALAHALQAAQGDLVVCTDADCIVPPQWLRHIASVFEQRAAVQLLTAPVLFFEPGNFAEHFQALDMTGTMLITGAGIHSGWQRMGNGANLAYRRGLHSALEALEKTAHRASGDDMFLLQQTAQHFPEGVFFLKSTEAVVLTAAMPDWLSFFRQRLRWGGKNAVLPEWPIRLALLLVWLNAWAVLLSFPLVLWYWWLPAVALGLKAWSDQRLLRRATAYFEQSVLMERFGRSFVAHTLYIVLVGTASIFMPAYGWKGRRVR